MMEEEAVTMAQCWCPSQGEGSVRMVTHLPGCGFLEDLVAGSCCDVDEIGPLAAPERELSDAQKALADSRERHDAELAEIDDAYADDSWRTNWT
jgi:hypothetical protein